MGEGGESKTGNNTREIGGDKEEAPQICRLYTAGSPEPKSRVKGVVLDIPRLAIGACPVPFRSSYDIIKCSGCGNKVCHAFWQGQIEVQNLSTGSTNNMRMVCIVPIIVTFAISNIDSTNLVFPNKQIEGAIDCTEADFRKGLASFGENPICRWMGIGSLQNIENSRSLSSMSHND